jgi:RHS repeat-associated protein
LFERKKDMKKLFITLITIVFLFCFSFLGTAQETSEMDASSSGYASTETNVGNSGAFSYTYPIKLPPGTNGMGPQLALTYNSSGGESMLGMGWGLSGFPVIIRDPSYPIDFNDDDHYLYNGQRLIWVPQNTDDVVNPGYYHTERESYVRIKAHNLNSSNSNWVVTLKNGTKLYFGYNSADHTRANDGHIDAVGKDGKARVWALSKVEDVHGNYYTIKYFEDDDGDYYPLNITYTMNTNNPLSSYRTVEFYYKAAPDSDCTDRYVPTLVRLDKRLKWIVVKMDGNLLCKYRIDYEKGSSTGRFRLARIVEFGDEGSRPGYKNGNSPIVEDNYNPNDPRIPAIKFRYSDRQGEHDTWERYKDQGDVGYLDVNGTTGRYPVIAGDWNGDGKTDMARVSDSGINFKISTGDGWQHYSYLEGWGSDDYADGNRFPIITGDWNGDGKTDIARVGSNGIFFKISTGEDWEDYQSIAEWGQEEFCDANKYPLLTGDWNGDGRTDVGRVGSDGVYFKISTSKDWIDYDFLTSFGLDDYKDENRFPIFTGDWNGDGRTDVARVGKKGINFKISSSTYGWQHYGIIEGLGTDSGYTDGNEFPVFTGDWNGDGKTDVARVSTTDIKFRVSTGKGFIKYPYIENFYTKSGYTNGNEFPILIGDWNGDGKTDIARISSNDVKFRMSTGNGWTGYAYIDGSSSDPTIHGIARNDGYEDGGKYPVLTGDWNGDGRTDVGRVIDQKAVFYFHDNRGSTSYPDLLVEIENHDVKTTITYLPATQFAKINWNSLDYNVGWAVYPKQSVYPYIANKSAQYLVESVTVDDDYGPSSLIQYHYHNGKYHSGSPPYRKNLLFEWVKKIYPDGSCTKTYFKQDDPCYSGIITKKELYGNDGKLYLLTRYSYDKRIIFKFNFFLKFGGAIYHIYKTAEYTENYNGQEGEPVIYKTAFLDYDDYGNLEKTKQYGQYKDNDGKDEYENDNVEIVTAYAKNLDKYVMVPKRVRKRGYNLDNKWEVFSDACYLYDNMDYGEVDKGLLTTQRLENGDDDVTNRYGYDYWGSLTWFKDGRASAGEYSDADNTLQIEYDEEYHTYPVSSINALGHITVNKYDELMRIEKTTDPNDASGCIKYDTFGRVVMIHAPYDDADYYSIEILYADSESPRYVKTSRSINIPQREVGDSAFESYTYFDGQGRVIQTKVEDENYSWTTVDYYYDESGRNYKISMPYTTEDYANSDPNKDQRYSHYEYDTIGRVKKAHGPDQTFSEYVYGKNSVKTIDPLRHVTKREIRENMIYNRLYNADTELYATTTIKSASNGTQIIDTKGNTISVETDMLGRKLSYLDPDMGHWEYTYDENGNTTSRTDGKDQRIIFTYDKLNRPTHKYYGLVEDTHLKTRYYYDEPGHGYAKGRLTRMVIYENPGSSSILLEEEYSYDKLGRITSVTRTIDGISRTVSFEYDALSRVVKETYPDGEIVTCTYNGGGMLESVIGATDIYISHIDYTATGKIENLAYGNYTSTSYQYDPESDRLESIDTSNLSEHILDLSYKYDAAGNLIFRKNDTGSTKYTEAYEYDEFYRLIKAVSSDNYYGVKEYAYDELNNITRKDGRIYEYNYLLPHAVSDDGRYSYTYDPNGNLEYMKDMGSMKSFDDGMTIRKIDYDYENRVESISDGGSYWYDDSGTRIKKTENGVTTYYFFPIYEEKVEQSTAEQISSYFANGMRIAQRTKIKGQCGNGTLIYFHTDHLGSITLLTDHNGDLIQATGYTPFGSLVETDGSPESYTDYMFTGQEREGTTAGELYYYGARYYDPELGRFLQADTILDGLNRYTYCGNNPINYVDPSGFSDQNPDGTYDYSQGWNPHDNNPPHDGNYWNGYYPGASEGWMYHGLGPTLPLYSQGPGPQGPFGDYSSPGPPDTPPPGLGDPGNNNYDNGNKGGGVGSANKLCPEACILLANMHEYEGIEIYSDYTNPEGKTLTCCSLLTYDFNTNANVEGKCWHEPSEMWGGRNFNGAQNIDLYNYDLREVLINNKACNSALKDVMNKIKNSKNIVTPEEAQRATNFEGRRFIIVSNIHMATIAPDPNPYDANKGPRVFQIGGVGTHYFAYTASVWAFKAKWAINTIIIEVFPFSIEGPMRR